MGPYHIVLTHFPIALWTLAMAVILLRVLSAGPLARRLDQALVPLLTVALLFGLAAYATGTQVWDWESISASPLGRKQSRTVRRTSWPMRQHTSIPVAGCSSSTATIKARRAGTYWPLPGSKKHSLIPTWPA